MSDHRCTTRVVGMRWFHMETTFWWPGETVVSQKGSIYMVRISVKLLTFRTVHNICNLQKLKYTMDSPTNGLLQPRYRCRTAKAAVRYTRESCILSVDTAGLNRNASVQSRDMILPKTNGRMLVRPYSTDFIVPYSNYWCTWCKSDRLRTYA